MTQRYILVHRSPATAEHGPEEDEPTVEGEGMDQEARSYILFLPDLLRVEAPVDQITLADIESLRGYLDVAERRLLRVRVETVKAE